jgi:hypothetical protein
MTSNSTDREAPARMELVFRPLHANAPALAFPCDASGCVDLDSLSEQGRCNYLYARVVTGHEFAWPVVRCAELH